MKLNAVKTTVVLSANSFSGLFQFFYVDTVKFLGKACDILKYATIYKSKVLVKASGSEKSQLVQLKTWIALYALFSGTNSDDCIVYAVQFGNS